MSNVESIERQIAQLSSEDLVRFREWYAAFDAEAWDREFEADVKAGKLEALAQQALRGYDAGQSTTF